MFFITAIGADSPGMAHALAQRLSDANCNIEDATMTRLSGLFAMILAVTPPANSSADELARELEALRASHGLTVHVESVENAAPARVVGARFMISAYGPERTGLLSGLTGVLALHGVNITDVQTRVASHGAAYVMLFEVELPPDLQWQTLESALQTEAARLNVSVSLHAQDEETL